MNASSSIFIDKNSDKKKLSRTDIISSIPQNALKNPDVDLQDCKTEWRWRIFRFPIVHKTKYRKPLLHEGLSPVEVKEGEHYDESALINRQSFKESVEISFKKPNELRLYINTHGDWVNRDVDVAFDKYVVEQYYCYTD